MVENILKVDLDSPKGEIKKVLTSAASAYDVTLGGGIESVSIVSSIGSASIDNDVLYLDFPAQDTEPFIINNQSVKGASISGADITFASDTAVVSINSGVSSVTMSGIGTASIDNGLLNISVPAQDAFLINGDTVKALSLVGGVQYYDSSTQVANVTVPAGITNVSVVGAGKGSISGNKLLLTLPSSLQKLNPQFALTPANVTIGNGEPATITASHLSDGVVSVIPNETFTSTVLSANSFRIIGSNLGEVAKDTDLGFWLYETDDYYGAMKNVYFNILPKAPDIYWKFDDSADLWKNSGSFEGLTFSANYGGEYSEGGVNGSGCCYFSAGRAINAATNLTNFYSSSWKFSVYMKLTEGVRNFLLSDDNATKWVIHAEGDTPYFSFGIKGDQQVIKNNVTPLVYNEWVKILMRYDAAEKTFEAYVNDEYQGKLENVTFTDGAFGFSTSQYLYLDEWQVTKF